MLTLDKARSWYSKTDPVHGFDHIRRVYHMAKYLATTEGADIDIVSAAALLHDVEGSQTEGGEDGRQDHHQASADFAQKVLQAEGWPEERIAAVQHCIRAHRFRHNSEPPNTLEAKILFDADKLDVIGAVGVVRTIAFDVVVGKPIFSEPSQKFLETGIKQLDEPHSSYHEFLFKLIKIKDLLHTSSAREIAENRHQFLVDFFNRLAAEERGEL
jgi:uncharacterized protein